MLGLGMRRAASVLAVLAAGLVGAPAAPAQNLMLHSSSITPGQPIPVKYTQFGDNVSPELNWMGAPAGTQSFAIIMDDPDAPTPEPFVHWVIYNIPASVTRLPEGLPADATLTNPQATQGPSGMRRVGYVGPRPPAGPAHNYNFTLYALSTPPNLPEGLGKAQLLERIQGSILAEAKLVAPFQRPE